MIEGFIKKTKECMEMIEKNMEMMEKNIDTLFSKNGFDVKKMKSSFSHSVMLKPQFHNSISLSLPPNSATIQSHQRLSYCLAPFSHP
jgi:hypothetical protein